jgi:hypothetical protein
MKMQIADAEPGSVIGYVVLNSARDEKESMRKRLKRVSRNYH